MVHKPVDYGFLKWPDVDMALKNKWIIWPLGSLEQHGPHLPLAVDSILAEAISRYVAQNVKGLIVPVLPFGARSLPNSGGGPNYPGTVHVRGDLLVSYYRSILESFLFNGARRIALINGHWENEAFLIEAVEQCREFGILTGKTVIALSWWSVVSDDQMKEIFGRFDGWHVEHAGQTETALMMCIAPDLVEMERVCDYRKSIPAGIYRYPTPKAWEGNEGVLSSASHVTREMGERLKAIVVDKIVSILKNAK